MANEQTTQYINKVVYAGNTLIDLTGDTVTADKLLDGFTAHDASGAIIKGTCTYDADTSDANALASEIITSKTAYVNGQKITGTMKYHGSSGGGTITTKTGEYTIQAGYHDGGGKVTIDPSEQSKIISSNIIAGVTILGVEGSLKTGTESVTATSKTVTPNTSVQRITPGEGYNFLSEVTVKAIPYEETPNAKGGTTVSIASSGE